MNSEQWANAECIVNGECMVNNMWMQDKKNYLECLGSYPCIAFGCLRGKTKLHVCIAISLNIILFDWTINEHWTDSERKVKGERKRSRAEIADVNAWCMCYEHTVNAQKNGKVERFRDCCPDSSHSTSHSCFYSDSDLTMEDVGPPNGSPTHFGSHGNLAASADYDYLIKFLALGKYCVMLFHQFL